MGPQIPGQACVLDPGALKSPQASVSSFAKQNPFLKEAGGGLIHCSPMGAGCKAQCWEPHPLFSSLLLLLACWPQSPLWNRGIRGLALLPFPLLFSSSQMTGCHPTLSTNSAPFPSGPRWAERRDGTSRSPRDTSEYSGPDSRVLWLDLPPSHTYSLPGALSLQGEKGSRGEKVSLKGLGPPLFGTGLLESHSS